MRIITDGSDTSEISPEGAHQDGYDVIAIVGINRKNITGELINPIIQATSKRLDKPEQIREAVGLMMTKAGLEKEMYDAKPGTVAKNVQDMVKSGKYTEEEAWAIIKDLILLI